MNDQDETERAAALLKAALSAAADVMVIRDAPESQRVTRVKHVRGWLIPLATAASVVVIALGAVAGAHLLSPSGELLGTHPVSSVGKQGTPQTTAAASQPAPTTARSAPVGQPTTSAPAATTAPATTGAPKPTASFTFVPMQTATGGDFYSPSGNIDCEIDYRVPGGQTEVYCLTVTPPRSVTMGASGRYTTCTGDLCLANAGENTPTLAYGTETGLGPFLCVSATTGVTCTANGKGFMISVAGITPVPA